MNHSFLAISVAFILDLLITGSLATSCWPCLLMTGSLVLPTENRLVTKIFLALLLLLLFTILLDNPLYAFITTVVFITPLLLLPAITIPGILRSLAAIVIGSCGCIVIVTLLADFATARSLVTIPTIACAFAFVAVYYGVGRPDDRL